MKGICYPWGELMGALQPVARFFVNSQRFFIVIEILVRRTGGSNMNRNMGRCVMCGEDVEIFIVGIILGSRLCLIGRLVRISWLLLIGIVLLDGVRERGDLRCIVLIFFY